MAIQGVPFSWNTENIAHKVYRLQFFCHEFPPIGGGASTALDHLTKKLAHAGHHVQVITIGTCANPGDQVGASLAQGKEIENRTIIRLGKIRKKGFFPSFSEYIRSYLALRFQGPQAIDYFKPDAVISYFAFPAGHAIMKATKARRIPHLVWVRGADAPGFKEDRLRGVGEKIMYFLTKPVLKTATLVLTNGKHLKALVQRALPQTKVISIANGVNVPSLTSTSSVKHTSSQGIRLLYVGQLTKRKRIEEALKGVIAFAERTRQKVCFNIVGDGAQKAMLQKMAESAKLENLEINFYGYMSREKLADFYPKHDIFIHLSREEGISNTLLESLIHGLALLGSKEVVYELDQTTLQGEILEEYTPEKIAGALQNMTNNLSNWKKTHRVNQSKKVAESFSWDSHMQKFLKQLEAIL